MDLCILVINCVGLRFAHDDDDDAVLYHLLYIPCTSMQWCSHLHILRYVVVFRAHVVISDMPH